MGRSLSSDPIKKTATILYAEEGVIQSVQDVEDILAANKAEYNSYRQNAGWKGTHHKIASVGLVPYFDLIQKGVINPQDGSGQWKDFKRWLNDSDHVKWRTRPGKI